MPAVYSVLVSGAAVIAAVTNAVVATRVVLFPALCVAVVGFPPRAISDAASTAVLISASVWSAVALASIAPNLVN